MAQSHWVRECLAVGQRNLSTKPSPAQTKAMSLPHPINFFTTTSPPNELEVRRTALKYYIGGRITK